MGCAYIGLLSAEGGRELCSVRIGRGVTLGELGHMEIALQHIASIGRQRKGDWEIIVDGEMILNLAKNRKRRKP